MQDKEKDRPGISVQSEEQPWTYAPYIMGKAQAVVCPFPRQPESDNHDSNNSEELCQIRSREDMPSSSPEGDKENESIIMVETKQQDESIINVTMEDVSEKLRIQDDSLLDKLESFQNYSLSQTFTLHQSFQAILSDIKQQEMLASGAETTDTPSEQQQDVQTGCEADSQIVIKSETDSQTVIKQESQVDKSEVQEIKGRLVYTHDPKYESIVQTALLTSGISYDVTNGNIEDNQVLRNPKRKRQPSPDVPPMAIVKSESVDISTQQEDQYTDDQTNVKIPSYQIPSLSTPYTKSIQIRSEINTVLNLTTCPPEETSKQTNESCPKLPQVMIKPSPETQSSQHQSWQQFMTKYLPNHSSTPPWLAENDQSNQNPKKQTMNISFSQAHHHPTTKVHVNEFSQKEPTKDGAAHVKLEPKENKSEEIHVNPCKLKDKPNDEPNSISNSDEPSKRTSPKLIQPMPKDIIKITHFGASPVSESTPILEHQKSRTKLSPLFPMMPETTPEFQRSLKRVALSASPINLPNNSGILAESTPENHLQNARSKSSPNNFPDFSGRLSPYSDPFFFPPPAHQNQLRQTSPTNFRQVSPKGYFGMHQPAPAHHGMDMFYGSHNPYSSFYGGMYSNPYQNPMHQTPNMMYHQSSIFQQQHHQQMPPPFGIPSYSQQNTQHRDESLKMEATKTNKHHDAFGHPFKFHPFHSQPKEQQESPHSTSQHQDPQKQSPHLNQLPEQPVHASNIPQQHSHQQNLEITKPQTFRHHGSLVNDAQSNNESGIKNTKSSTPNSFGLSIPLQLPASSKLMITPPGLKKQEHVLKPEFPNFYKDTSIDGNYPNLGNPEQNQGVRQQGGYVKNFSHKAMDVPHVTRVTQSPHGACKTDQTCHGSEKPQNVNHEALQMNNGPQLQQHHHLHMPNNISMSSHQTHQPNSRRLLNAQPPNNHPCSDNQNNTSSHPNNTSNDETGSKELVSEEQLVLTGPPPNNKRKGRINYTTKQLNAMDRAFEGDPYPKPDLLDHLSSDLQIPVSKLKVWFQNKRARARKKGGDKSIQPPTDKFNQVYKNLMAFRKPMVMSDHVIPNQYPITSQSPVSTVSNPSGCVMSQPAGSVMSQPAGSAMSYPPGSAMSHPPGPVTSHPPGPVTSHCSLSIMSHPSISSMSHYSGAGMSHPSVSRMQHSSALGMPRPQISGMQHSSMSGMQHSSMSGMQHSSMSGMSHSSMSGMSQPHMSTISNVSSLSIPSLPPEK